MRGMKKPAMKLSRADNNRQPVLGRDTPSSTLLATTRRAGALFAPSGVKIRLFGEPRPRSFRLAEDKEV